MIPKSLPEIAIPIGVAAFVALGWLGVWYCMPKFAPYESKFRKPYSQTCNMCGEQWWITPKVESKAVPPTTVEWCFRDGNYCDYGFAMLQRMQHVMIVEWRELDEQMREHCRTCKGCRYAYFQPQQWREMNDDGI